MTIEFSFGVDFEFAPIHYYEFGIDAAVSRFSSDFSIRVQGEPQ